MLLLRKLPSSFKTRTFRDHLLQNVPKMIFSKSNSFATMTENQFHDIADETLHELQDFLSPLENINPISLGVEDIEVISSQGVLKLDLGSQGNHSNQYQLMEII